MAMKFGLSMFGALQTPDDQLQQAIQASFSQGEISVWRGPWLIWYPPGEERSLIRANGALNEAMLPRLVNLLNFTSQNNLHLQLVGAPNVLQPMDTPNLNRYYDAWNEIMNAISGFGADVWSTDIWNEESGKDSVADASNPFPITRRLYEITRQQAPNHKLTVSQSYPAQGGLSAVERDFLRWVFMRRNAGIQLDYYAAHFDRSLPAWSRDNEDRFRRLTTRIQGGTNPGETTPVFELDPNPEVWDDEGAREGYQNFPDPSVQQQVDAAQGAENAGCYVHVLHSECNFDGQIIAPGNPTGTTLSITEIQKILRIKNEVIDSQPPPPPPPPEPPPEDC